MKVLLVATSMEVGGVQMVVKTLAEELATQGTEVAIVSLHGHDAVTTSPSIRRRSIASDLSWRGRWRAIVQLHHLIAEQKPDIVHAHAFHANLTAWLAVAARIRGRPHLVRTVHSVHEGGRLHRWLYRATRFGATDTAVSSAVNEAHRMDLHPRRVIGNGIEIHRFRPDRSARSRVREELGIDSASTVIINVGRLTPAKDHDLLLSAYSKTASTVRNTHLVVVGDGPLRGEIATHVSTLGISSITLTGHSVAIPELLSAADLYLSTSAWEGFPVGLIEAKASGLLVVATDVGGTREVLGSPDFLVASRDPADLASAVIEALASDSTRDSRRLDESTTRHSSEAMAARWLSLYRSLSS